jgi:thiol-disulfide isomerase/thioredoxin
MKVLTILTALAIAPIALAHPDHNPPEHPDHPSDHPEHPSDHPEHPSDHPEHPADHPEHPTKEAAADNSAAVADAKAIFDKVHKKYKEAKGIQEVVTLTLPAMMGGEPETLEVNVVVGDNGGTLDLKDEMSASWSDGNIYFKVSELEGKFVKMEAETFYAGLLSISDGGAIPGIWTVAFRDSDNLDDWIGAFSMGMPGAAIDSVSTSKDASGGEVDVVTLKTMMGTVDVTVTKDSVVKSGVMTIAQPGMPAMKMSAISELKFLSEAPKVEFDVTGLEEFSSAEAMFDIEETEEPPAEKSLDGKDAPDFTLARMDGSGDVTLSSLKGEVIVLDFWSTWCGPCRKGLPFLNEFDAWAKEQGLNVRVYAVNVWERGKSADVLEKVKKFWADNKFSTAVLMGSGDDKLTSNYGITGIPTTVIIGRDGTIANQHSGFGGGDAMLKDLKDAVAEALGGGHPVTE